MDRRITVAVSLIAVIVVVTSGCVITHHPGRAVDTLHMTVTGVSSFNNPIMDVSSKEVTDAGYSQGDDILMEFNGRSCTGLVIEDYGGVGTLTPFMCLDGDQVTLGVFNGDMNVLLNLRIGDEVTVTYIGHDTLVDTIPEYTCGSSDDRSDYETDADFANFYMVDTTHVHGALYRSASPFSSSARAPYVSTLLDAAGVPSMVVMNMSPESLDEYCGSHSGYAVDLALSGAVIADSITPDVIFHPEVIKRLLEEVTEQLETYGCTCVCCDMGKDRTGFLCAILEAVAGDSYSDIRRDFQTTVNNLYGIGFETEEIETVTNILLDRQFLMLTKVASMTPEEILDYDWSTVDPDTFDAPAMTREYLKGIGMTDTQLDHLAELLRARLRTSSLFQP